MLHLHRRQRVRIRSETLAQGFFCIDNMSLSLFGSNHLVYLYHVEQLFV